MRTFHPVFIRPTEGLPTLDRMLYRGSQNGRVLASDFKTGNRLWQTTIADQKVGETTPAAPNGLIFTGNASGDTKGGKGRVYALDAKTGKIVWEFFLVPKTEGAPARGPEGASPLDRSTGTTLLAFPSAAAERGRRSPSTRPRKNCTFQSPTRRRRTRSTCGRVRTYSRARSSC
jgi:outer membrane protein assembly factor BamB